MEAQKRNGDFPGVAGGAGGEDVPRSMLLAATSCPRSGANASPGTVRIEVASNFS